MEPTTLVTGNVQIDHWLSVIGACVTLTSTVASVLNARVRSTLDAGETPNKTVVLIGSALNFAAINIDKGLQMLKLFRTGSVGTVGAVTPVSPQNGTVNDGVAIDPSTAPTVPALCGTCGRPV